MKTPAPEMRYLKGIALLELGEYQQARNEFEKIAQSPSQFSHSSALQSIIGEIDAILGKVENAEDNLQKALEASKKEFNPQLEMITLERLAALYQIRNLFGWQKRCLTQFLEVAHPLSNHWEIRGELLLARFYARRKLISLALNHFHKGMILAEKAQSDLERIQALYALNQIYIQIEAYDAAKSTLNTIEELMTSDAPPMNQLKLIGKIIEVQANLNEQTPALKRVEQADGIIQKTGLQKHKIELEILKASIYTENPDIAERILKETLPLANKLNNKALIQHIYYLLGKNRAEQKKYQAARAYFSSALKIAALFHNLEKMGRYLDILGTICMIEKQYELALACFLKAKNMRTLFEPESREMPKDKIIQLKRSLPPNKFREYLLAVSENMNTLLQEYTGIDFENLEKTLSVKEYIQFPEGYHLGR